MATGTVKWFHSKKGYGFLTNSENQAEIFVHFSAIKSEGGYKTLNEGDEVTFDIAEGKKGAEAQNVVVTKAAPRREREPRGERSFRPQY
jgi:CspA family cold shock protein